jgi:elongation factor G
MGTVGFALSLMSQVKANEFINEIRAEAVPTQYIKPIDQGIQAAMESGILTGFPMVDVKVTLFDGSYHELHSNEVAFRFAGSIAFKEAAKQASPVLLEPMMTLEIDVPEGHIAGVRSEIHTHRGRVECVKTTDGISQIEAIVPLSELLTSTFTGLAECPMKFVGYEAVRSSGPSDENASGVTANKPNRPRPGSRSMMARFNPEEE